MYFKVFLKCVVIIYIIVIIKYEMSGFLKIYEIIYLLEEFFCWIFWVMIMRMIRIIMEIRMVMMMVIVVFELVFLEFCVFGIIWNKNVKILRLEFKELVYIYKLIYFYVLIVM